MTKENEEKRKIKQEIRQDYDKENDILSFNWGTEVDCSEECETKEGHFFVIDYDKKGRIVGIEIFDWNKGRGKCK